VYQPVSAWRSNALRRLLQESLGDRQAGLHTVCDAIPLLLGAGLSVRRLSFFGRILPVALVVHKR
jgi:hypothetical protein